MDTSELLEREHAQGDLADGTKTSLRLWLRLLSCVNVIEAEISRRLRARFDMSLAKFDYLAQLYRSPERAMTMSELGRRLMVTGGNITGLTDRLARAGLVRRQPHPSDRRSRVIGLSAEGTRIFEEMAKAHEQWVRELLSSLGDAEKEEMLDRLAALKEAVPRASGDKESGS